MVSISVPIQLLNAPLDVYAKVVFIGISRYPAGRVTIKQLVSDLGISRRKVTESINALIDLKMVSRQTNPIGKNRVQSIFTAQPFGKWVSDKNPASQAIDGLNLNDAQNNSTFRSGKQNSIGLDIAWR